MVMVMMVLMMMVMMVVGDGDDEVIIYNDDFTTMEFVVMILVQVFLKSEDEAQALMLQVHHSDKAVVGIYSYDIAVSKARKATNMAREQGYPLRLTVEPEEN